MGKRERKGERQINLILSFHLNSFDFPTSPPYIFLYFTYFCNGSKIFLDQAGIWISYFDNHLFKIDFYVFLNQKWLWSSVINGFVAAIKNQGLLLVILLNQCSVLIPGAFVVVGSLSLLNMYWESIEFSDQ